MTDRIPIHRQKINGTFCNMCGGLVYLTQTYMLFFCVGDGLGTSSGCGWRMSAIY